MSNEFKETLIEVGSVVFGVIFSVILFLYLVIGVVKI